MSAFKTILVAVGHGPSSWQALDYGRQLARIFDGALHVTEVNPLVPETQTWVAPARDRTLTPISPGTLAQADAIAAYARRIHADLIVTDLVGSLDLHQEAPADRIVRRAACPVLTVLPQPSAAESWQENQWGES